MDINPVTAARTPFIPPTAEPAPSPGYGQADGAKDSITLATPSPDKSLQLDQLHERNNGIALQARATDQKLAAVADAVDRMKGTLEAVVKNFPPFSPESSERQKLLMSYISIRKELVRMMVPPPPPPLYEKVKHTWEKLFPTDTAGLSRLPGEMNSGTQDPELRSATIQLKHIQQGITSIRTTIKQSLSES